MWPRWIRAAAALWVAWDSKKRKATDWIWVLGIVLLGPFLLPIYMTVRPAVKGERRSDCLVWNFIVNLEAFLTWLLGLAGSAVFIENMTLPKDPNLAEVKRAEIKAGSIMGVIFFIIVLGLEKIGFEFLRGKIEHEI